MPNSGTSVPGDPGGKTTLISKSTSAGSGASEFSPKETQADRSRPVIRARPLVPLSVGKARHKNLGYPAGSHKVTIRDIRYAVEGLADRIDLHLDTHVVQVWIGHGGAKRHGIIGVDEADQSGRGGLLVVLG